MPVSASNSYDRGRHAMAEQRSRATLSRIATRLSRIGMPADSAQQEMAELADHFERLAAGAAAARDTSDEAMWEARS